MTIETIHNILDCLLGFGIQCWGIVLCCYIFLPSRIIDKITIKINK